MSDDADLLMPKLGLTMTEGTVARWLAAPGTRFAAGDAIVVIETDKIANEVEAPAAGELVTLLSGEGDVVPVGTPIARWRLDGASERAARPPRAPDERPTQTPRAEPPTAATAADATRIIATPYARRLAREASLDLADVAGSGPRGRIKAADVLRAREAEARGRAIAPAAISMQRVAPLASHSVSHSFVMVDVDVSALRALDARLAGVRDRAFERRAYIALACLKALDVDGDTSVRLGFQVDGGFASFDGDARHTLSAVAARLAHLQPDRTGGDIAIIISDGRTRLLVPTAPEGWRMALGVGGVRGGDARCEMSLALVYDAARIDHAFAVQLIERVVALLEEPLHLLAA